MAGLSRVSFNLALFAYLAAMLGYFAYLAWRKEALWRASSALAWVGLAANVVSVVSRGLAAHRVPWGNMYEFSTLLALLVVAGYLLIVEARYKVRTVGGFAIGFAVFTMAIATMFFYTGPAPLVPALNSYWIQIHVVAAIIGSSLFALGSGVLTPLYLYKAWRERVWARQEAAAAPGAEPPPIMGGSIDVAEPPHFAPGADEPAGPAPPRRGLLPGSQVLDRLAYKTIAFAFPVWTFAVIAGAIWAQEAWGRYWGWDPKETWSFITWVIFAAYLHARATAGWRGAKAAWIALVGFVSLLITYYAVNLWIVGLHSYRGF